MRFENYCLYSYEEESVSARVRVEIWNTHPLPPLKRGKCEMKTIDVKKENGLMKDLMI